MALLPGVDREQVQGAGGHQPQGLRAFEVEAGVAGAVEGRAHGAERTEDEVAVGTAGPAVASLAPVTALVPMTFVDGGHLIAP